MHNIAYNPAVRSRVFLLVSVLSLLALTGCSEYQRVLKSRDISEKYEYAKMYYQNGKYMRAATLLGDVVTIYRGTEEAEEATYLLAMSHYKMEDYVSSGEYFLRYVSNFPRGTHAEECRFLMAAGDYYDSPDARLDQAVTRRAIKEIDSFLDSYPRSTLADSATMMRLELTDKLCYKEYLSSKLYLDLGSYMGNNYEAAVITARNAQNEYPSSKYREDLAYIIFKARYEAAMISVAEKKADRLREAYDEYFTFSNEYHEGKYSKEVERDFARVKRMLDRYED